MQIDQRNQDCTIYVGNIDERVTEPLLWELFQQSAPVVNVNFPKDRVTGSHQGFGFVEFMTPEDAEYGSKVMHMIKLYGKPIRCNKAAGEGQVKPGQEKDIGANLFIGNLDPEVDEQIMHDTFSNFGNVVQIKVSKVIRSLAMPTLESPRALGLLHSIRLFVSLVMQLVIRPLKP